MLKVRATHQPRVDTHEFPEQAFEDELEECMTDFERILRTPLVERFYSGSPDSFCKRVTSLRMSLLQWMEPYKEQTSIPEVWMLFTVIGSLSYPELYLSQENAAEPRSLEPTPGSAPGLPRSRGLSFVIGPPRFSSIVRLFDSITT